MGRGDSDMIIPTWIRCIFRRKNTGISFAFAGIRIDFDANKIYIGKQLVDCESFSMTITHNNNTVQPFVDITITKLRQVGGRP